METALIKLDSVTYNGIAGFKFFTAPLTGNYISNGTIKIKCGNLITSAIDGEVFFSLKFIPDNISINIPSRLFDIIFYDNIAKDISDLQSAGSFINNFSGSFSKNNWYSKNWLNRLIAIMDLIIEEKIILLRNFKCLNTLQILALNLKSLILYSPEEILESVIYKVAPTSNAILSKLDISDIIEKNTTDFNYLINYLNLPNFILEELESLKAEDLLEVSYFNLNYYDSIARENLYPIMRRIVELDELLFNNFAVRFREIENQIRVTLGYNAVGSLFTETLLLKTISANFPNYQVISQFSPKWLKPQRFDIFIVEKNIAIEYNGIQHYEKVEYFGGELGLDNTHKRDLEKRKKCKANKCTLIEVRYDEDFGEAVERIKRIILKQTSQQE